ncbi:MAG: dehydrogenase [Propionibacteriaceae bacterium]|jgi:2-oxoisovalerate dehydrogenase E1 component|nr:dehydrogenase [Propionibacteriaceae bacterium]
MTKSIVINPFEVRAPGLVQPPSIPVNTYRFDLATEFARYGSETLINVLNDMMVIREFESMLDELSTRGQWQGIQASPGAPVYASVGQEAAVVGQALELGVEDQIFGSHRSHGEVLAKCFAAARIMDPEDVRATMEAQTGGQTLRHAEALPYESESELQANFILYGALAEVFARRGGFNGGMAGPLHVCCPAFGSMPNNAIVGGAAGLATGAALFKRINQRPGVVVANLGDAAAGCGPVWEAMSFAAMDQYRTLWPEEAQGRPPVLFTFFDNFYGMGAQTRGETMGFDMLARIGAGVDPEAMHAERVDGYDPMAVADATRRKKALLSAGRGPGLLDVVTYRTCGASAEDRNSYRTAEEQQMWADVDSIKAFSQVLIDAGVLSAGQIDDAHELIVEKIAHVLELVADDQADDAVDIAFVESRMTSTDRAEAVADSVEGEADSVERSGDAAEGVANSVEGVGDPVTAPAVAAKLLEPVEDNRRVRAISAKVRQVIDDGQPVADDQIYQFRDGLFEALVDAAAHDATMACWGQDNRDWGGAFGVYDGLTALLGYPRLFNAPITEAAIVGAGVGYALSGGRAVVELTGCDFLGRAGDELFNQMAKWSAVTGLTMPLVVRVVVQRPSDAQLGQDWSGMAAHVPGLRVYYPATPTDAKSMLGLALSGSEPVVFLESAQLYDRGEQFEPGGVPYGPVRAEEGVPAVRRTGDDVTIVTVGPSLYTGDEAASILDRTYGVSCDLIDLRFLTPVDLTPIIDSVKKTGRVVLVGEAVERGSYLHTIASTITQTCFDDLDAPVVVLGARSLVMPAGGRQDLMGPGVDAILDAIHERIMPLPGHHPTTDQRDEELLRRTRLGV